MRLKLKLKASFSLLAPLLLAVPVIMYTVSSSAAPMVLKNRYVQLGSSLANVSTNYKFGFDINSVSVLGSIKFEVCSNSPLPTDPCTAPVGFNASGALLTAQSGAIGFATVNSGSSNVILISRVPAGNLPGSSTYIFSPITNPQAAAQTFFVRISTYSSIDASGAKNEEGSVAFSTAVGLGVGAYVPPFLIFCSAVTVAPDCSTSNGFLLDMGELSTTTTRAITSQFAGATNDPGGYQVSLSGTTMTSGNNTISPLTVPTASASGTSQYGINLRANSSPSVGQDPVGAGSSVPKANYNTPNLFTFNNEMLTSSTFATDFNTMTVSYIVNVPKGQAPGIYNTTLTYTATAAF